MAPPKSSTIHIKLTTATQVLEGVEIELTAEPEIGRAGARSEVEEKLSSRALAIRWSVDGRPIPADKTDVYKARWNTAGLASRTYRVAAELIDPLTGQPWPVDGQPVQGEESFQVTPRAFSRGDTIPVALQRSATPPTTDQALWVAIRNRTAAMSFGGIGHTNGQTIIGAGYQEFIDRILCEPAALPGDAPDHKVLTRLREGIGSRVYGVGAYEALKIATQVFLLLESGVIIRHHGEYLHDELFDAADESGRIGKIVTFHDVVEELHQYLSGATLPYIERILSASFPGEKLQDKVFCYGLIGKRVSSPLLIELIWSYWHEEGMLAQTMGAVARRFQNVRGPGDRDPLANFEIAPLRPLNNLLWGYIQEELNRLTVRRRAYEYDHHYGLALYGKAVPTMRSADSRSKFLEGFHNLLHLCAIFFREDNDTTVIADGYPLLNALKEVHLLLAQGAHNQFGDLPWTARAEMLIQQWLLARPEMREFLQSRQMVPYKEPWMPQVDTMKTLQGWSDVTVTHFRDLAVYGEQLLLSVRYGDWIGINDENHAKNWARYWRPELQGYLHAYRAVTGIDLSNTETVDYTMPAVLLQRRLATQQAH
jgi:hypothetical protein